MSTHTNINLNLRGQIKSKVQTGTSCKDETILNNVYSLIQIYLVVKLQWLLLDVIKATIIPIDFSIKIPSCREHLRIQTSNAVKIQSYS